MNMTQQNAMTKEAMTEPPKVSWRRGSDPERDERFPDRGRRRFSLRRDIPDTEKGTKRPNNDGAFDGSFAGTARHRTDAYVLPWYLRSQYFTDGWKDTSIWRAAVSADRPCLFTTRTLC